MGRVVRRTATANQNLFLYEKEPSNIRGSESFTYIKEHRAATRQREMEKSAITEHTWSQHRPILWEETSVLDQASNNATLLFKEVQL